MPAARPESPLVDELRPIRHGRTGSLRALLERAVVRDFNDPLALAASLLEESPLVLESLFLQELQIRVVLCHFYRGIQLPPIQKCGVPAPEKGDEVRGRKNQLFLIATHGSSCRGRGQCRSGGI